MKNIEKNFIIWTFETKDEKIRMKDWIIEQYLKQENFNNWAIGTLKIWNEWNVKHFNYSFANKLKRAKYYLILCFDKTNDEVVKMTKKEFIDFIYKK